MVSAHIFIQFDRHSQLIVFLPYLQLYWNKNRCIFDFAFKPKVILIHIIYRWMEQILGRLIRVHMVVSMYVKNCFYFFCFIGVISQFVLILLLLCYYSTIHSSMTPFVSFPLCLCLLYHRTRNFVINRTVSIFLSPHHPLSFFERNISTPVLIDSEIRAMWMHCIVWAIV